MSGPARPGVLAAIGASLLWGGGTIATEAVLRTGVPSGPFTAIELTTSVVFLWVMCRLTSTAIPSVRTWWRAGLLGSLEPGLAYLLINAGLARTSATHGALISAGEPVLIALLGWLWLGAAIPRRLVAPMGLVLVGTMAVVTAQAGTDGASWVGDGLVALGILAAAIYVVGSARAAVDVAVLGLTLLQQLFAIAFVIPVVAISGLVGGGWGSGPDSLGPWLAVPVIGIGASALTFWLYLTALAHLAPSVAGQFLAIIPLVAFAGAVVILGEPAGVQAIAGAVVVIAALVAIARLEPVPALRAAIEPLGGPAG